MFEMITEACELKKLRWKMDSLKILINPHTPWPSGRRSDATHAPANATAEEVAVLDNWTCAPDHLLAHLPSGSHRIQKVDTLEVLGAVLDNQGSGHTSLQHQLLKAARHWGARRSALTSRHVPLLDRLRRFYTTVMATLLWASQGWAWTQKMATHENNHSRNGTTISSDLLVQSMRF